MTQWRVTLQGNVVILLEFHCHQRCHQYWGAAGGSNCGQAGAGKAKQHWKGSCFLREKGKLFAGGIGEFQKRAGGGVTGPSYGSGSGSRRRGEAKG